MSHGINCTPSKIIQWFTDSEKCLMHSNISSLEIVQISLSNDQLDALIKQGEHISNELKKDTQSEQQHYIKQMPKGECSYCDLEYQKPTWVFPPHTASPRCQSGGYNHCTCDTCF